MKLDVPSPKLEVEVKCLQKHWSDEEGRRLPIHGYEVRNWRHLDAFEFETKVGQGRLLYFTGIFEVF